MALVTNLEKVTMQRNSVHDPVECTYSVFNSPDGKKFIQIDTYGSASRKFLGKKSQSIQFDEVSARKLLEIFRSEGLS